MYHSSISPGRKRKVVGMRKGMGREGYKGKGGGRKDSNPSRPTERPSTIPSSSERGGHPRRRRKRREWALLWSERGKNKTNEGRDVSRESFVFKKKKREGNFLGGVGGGGGGVLGGGGVGGGWLGGKDVPHFFLLRGGKESCLRHDQQKKEVGIRTGGTR